MEVDGKHAFGVEAGVGFPSKVEVSMIASKRSEEDRQLP